MAINIQSKTDYSYLFSSLGSSSSTSGSTNLNFLSDYAAIKNGSYGKLMKAYFSSDVSDEVSSLVKSSSKSISSEEKKALTRVQSASDALKESADALLETGKESLFTKKEVTSTDESGVESTTKEYDVEAIYKAVKGFVDDYNDVINAVDDAGNEKVTNRAVSLANITGSNEDLLNDIGITINDDCTLSLDEKAFKNADMATAKTLFNGTGSYAYRVSAQASLIDFAADSEATKANTYTASGTVDSTGSVGNLFSSYF